MSPGGGQSAFSIQRPSRWSGVLTIESLRVAGGCEESRAGTKVEWKKSWGGDFSQICCGELALSEQVSLVCYFCGSTFLLSLPESISGRGYFSPLPWITFRIVGACGDLCMFSHPPGHHYENRYSQSVNDQGEYLPWQARLLTVSNGISTEEVRKGAFAA